MALTIEPKRCADGKTVLLRYAYANKTRKYFSTGIKIPESDFKKGVVLKPVRSSNPNAAHLNRMAEQVYNRLISIQTQLQREDKIPTADLVYYLYHRVETVAVTKAMNSKLSVAFAEFLKAADYDAATEKLYKTLYSHLLSCYGDVSLAGYDLDEWHRFRFYLKSKRLTANTICIRLSKLKHFLKFIRQQGVEINIDQFPMPKEEIKMVSLDTVSLQKIIDHKPQSFAMELVRDLCLFQCFTGLRISDLKRLNKNHVAEAGQGLFQISMRALKTNNPMLIPLTEEAISILRKYNFHFPEVTEQHYNRKLKKLAEAAGIDEEIEWLSYDDQGRKSFKRKKLSQLITSHACARTAISYLMSRYEPKIVARIVGKSMDTIMKYYYGRSTKADITEAQRRLMTGEPFMRVA